MPKGRHEPGAAENEPALQRARTMDSEFESYAGQISRHSAVFLAGIIFIVGLGYPFKIYVARVIGASGLGLYALGVTVTDFLSLFATLGLANAAGRYIAVYSGLQQHHRIRRLVAGGLALVLFSSVVLAFAMYFARQWISDTVFNEPRLALYLPFFAALLPLNVGIAFLGQALRGFQEVIKRTLITTFVKFTLRVLISIGLLVLGWGLLGYIVGEVLSSILAILLLLWAVRAIVLKLDSHPQPDVADKWVGETAAYAGSMLALGLLGFASGKADHVLVGVYLSARDLGVYSAALTTAAFVTVFLQSLNSIFGPIIANLHARSQIDLLQRLFQASTKWALALTIPGVVVMVFFAQTLMQIFGAEFEAGAAVLALVAAGQLVNVGAGSVGSILLMSGNQRFEILAVAATAVSTLSLNLLLIPRMGILGAACAVAIGIAISNLLRLWMVYRLLRITPFNLGYLRLLAPTALAILCAHGVRTWSLDGGLTSYVGLLLALVATYLLFTAIALLLSFDADDRIIARAAWKRFGWGRAAAGQSS